MAAKAFAVMFMSLWATSGLFGAIPFGDPARDLYDKIVGWATGIDPDLEREFREIWPNAGMGEAAARGLFLPASQRTGVVIMQGVSDKVSIADLLGPTGAVLTTIPQVVERWEQGHKSLATALLMPSIIRNIIKANYEGEYGIVTQKGNIVPSDFTSSDYLMQIIGFTPSNVMRTRQAILARDRLAVAPAVAKERYQDNLTTLRVKEINARRRGDTEEAEALAKERLEVLQEIRSHNASHPDMALDMRRVTQTVNRRVLEQLKAQRGIISNRRVPTNRRAAVSSQIEEAYPMGYIEDGL
jgi:hypothetical protein